MRLVQPVSQVRLTNVAIVRLKKHGYRFEVACYKNKVLNWRSGVEQDIEEVLQTHTVFHNVSKGEYAKQETLVKAFGNANHGEICKLILEKGELQVSEKEREVALEAIFKDVATIVAEYTIHPQTKMPLTRSMIEGAIRDVGYSLRLDEPPKKQALKIVELLITQYPNQIERACMRLRIIASPQHRHKVKEFLTNKCQAIIEHESIDSHTNPSPKDRKQTTSVSSKSKKSDKKSVATLQSGAPHSECEAIKQGITSNENADSSPYKVVFMCFPKWYRCIDDFVLHTLKPPGTLQLLTSTVKGMVEEKNTSIGKAGVINNNNSVDKSTIVEGNDEEGDASKELSNNLQGLSIDVAKEVDT